MEEEFGFQNWECGVILQPSAPSTQDLVSSIQYPVSRIQHLVSSTHLHQPKHLLNHPFIGDPFLPCVDAKL